MLNSSGRCRRIRHCLSRLSASSARRSSPGPSPGPCPSLLWARREHRRRWRRTRACTPQRRSRKGHRSRRRQASLAPRAAPRFASTAGPRASGRPLRREVALRRWGQRTGQCGAAGRLVGVTLALHGLSRDERSEHGSFAPRRM